MNLQILQQAKKVASSTAFYSLTQVMQKGITFIILPVLTLYLTPSDFGILGTVQSIAGVLQVFMLMALHGAANRFFFLTEHDPDQLKRLWGTVYSMAFLGGLIVIIFSLTAGHPIIAWALKDIPFYPHMLLGIIGTYFYVICLIYFNTLQARQLPLRYAMTNLGLFLLTLALNLYLVIKAQLHAEGPLLGQAVARILFVVVFLFCTRKHINWVIDKKLFVSITKYSSPLILHSFISMIGFSAYFVVLNKVRGTTETGLFNFVFQICLPLTILAEAFTQATSPWMMRTAIHNPDEYKSKIRKLGTLAVSFGSVVGLFYIIVAKWALIHFFDRAYHVTTSAIPFLVLGGIFHLLYVIIVNPLFCLENTTKFIPRISLLVTALELACLILLTPRLGFLGSCIAWFFGNLLWATVAYWQAQRVFKINWEFRMAIPLRCFLFQVFMEYFQPDWARVSWALVTIITGSIFFASFLTLLQKGFFKFGELKAYPDDLDF